VSALSQPGRVEGGTRWGRTSVLLVIALCAVAAMLWAVRTQVIASSLVFEGSTAQFSSSGINGTDVGMGMTRIQRNTGTAIDDEQVLRFGFANGSINGICISQTQSLAGIGSVTLLITAGDGNSSTYEIAGSNVTFDVITANTTGSGIRMDGRAQLGLATQDITTTKTGTLFDPNPLDQPANAPGWYGIDADYGYLLNVKGTIYDGYVGGPFSMPGLTIKVVPGTVGCQGLALPN
jgi:hypothetical protein